jgi:hypothetical protein
MHRAIINMQSMLNQDVSELLLQRNYDYNNRLFALCQSCYWTATIFTKLESYECPVCHANNVALIPLNLEEKYEYQFKPKHGLDIKFSIDNKTGK